MRILARPQARFQHYKRWFFSLIDPWYLRAIGLFTLFWVGGMFLVTLSGGIRTVTRPIRPIPTPGVLIQHPPLPPVLFSEVLEWCGGDPSLCDPALFATQDRFQYMNEPNCGVVFTIPANVQFGVYLREAGRFDVYHGPAVVTNGCAIDFFSERYQGTPPPTTLVLTVDEATVIPLNVDMLMPPPAVPQEGMPSEESVEADMMPEGESAEEPTESE